MPDRFRLLHVRPVRRHPVRAGLVSVAIAAGVTLVVAVLVLSRSVTESVGALAGQVGEVDLIAQGAGSAGMPVDTLDRVRAVDGVEVAAPVVRMNVLINGRSTLLLGVGPEALALGLLPAHCVDQLRSVEPAALDRGVLSGPDVGRASEVSLTPPGGRTAVAHVVGRITCPEARRLNGGRFLVGTVSSVEELVGRPDRVDMVLVKTSGSTDAVAASLERAIAGAGAVERPRDLVAQAERAVQPFQQALLVLAVLALVVAGFLTFNAVTVSVLERRQDLATVWALGTRRRTVVGGMLAEAALMGAFGAATGAALGVALAARLVERIPAFVVDTVGVAPTLTVMARDIGIGLALGLSSAVAAAVFPTVQALRTRDPSMLRPGGVPDSPTRGASPQAALSGLAVLITGMTGVAVFPSATVAALGAVIVGVLVATFGFAPALAAVSAWFAGRLGRSGRVAALVIGRAPRRVWSIVMAIAVAAAVVVTTGGLADAQVGTFDRMWRSLATVDVWVQTHPEGRAPLGPRLPAETRSRAADVDGVTAVSGGWSMLIDLEGRRVTLDAMLPGSRTPGYHLASPAAQRRIDAGTGLVVTSNMADRLGLRRGDDLSIPTPRGPQRLEIVDVIHLLTSTEGLLGVPYEWAADAFDQRGFSWLEIDLDPSADPQVALGAVEQAVTVPDGPGVVAVTGTSHYRVALRTVRQSAATLSAMQLAIGLAATLAVATTLLLSVNERRRELGVLRAVGLGASSVRRMLLTEAFAYGVVGLGLGAVLGVVQFRVALHLVATLTGTGLDRHLGVDSVLHAGLAVGGLSLVAGGLAARAGASGPVDSALDHE